MKNLHQAFQKILDDMNSGAKSEATNEQIEAVIRNHLENALLEAGKEIEKLFNMPDVVVSVQIREVCVYSKKKSDE